MAPRAARDVFLPVAAQPSADAFVETAERAETLGYERVWVPETWGRDAVTLIATMAARTEDIGLGTSIANVYSRSPALLGQTAATLQEVSDGRFRMGLGPSGPILVEGWHSVDYERPLRRTRETIDIVRQVLSGDVVSYDGDVFSLSGFGLRCEPPEIAPPIDAAGMGPKAVELAGRFADGWHALLLTRDGVRERVEDFQRGSDLGNRDPADQRVTLSLTCCALDDREAARDLVRQHLAFYVGGMGTFYREALAKQGYEDTANRIAQAWANRDQEAAIDEIGDELLDDLAVAGTPEECREQLSRFAELDGVDAVSVSFPRGADLDAVENTMAVLAPDAPAED